MPSRPVGAVLTNMGANMIVLLFCLCVGSISAIYPDELRPSFEFLEYNTNLDEPRYRLTDYVQPTEVYVDLDVYLEQSRMYGVVQLIVQVQEENMTQIVLHQKVVSIEAVTVLNANNQQMPLRFPGAYDTDDYFEILKINFESPIPVGQYTIQIRYIGQINENPIDRGFYKGYYYYNNQKYEYATTQFQPFHARKAFPCFDEPQFKSRYVISITRDAGLSQSYSNMDIAEVETLNNSRIRETFLPTPIISAYLIAFHVSPFVATQLSSTPTKPFQIISRPGVNDQHPYAADIGRRITDELDDYCGIDYYEMGQGQPMKNDHIALPDFPSGAMENWGMVNYREAYLLYDENNTNLLNKIFIATIIAHELAHKWFGNLVTNFWWSNLWLNESYASFFEYFAAHYADPELELDDQFVVDYVHSALNWDAGDNATPMNYSTVASNPSVSGHFSTTSYAKGASVLRMLEHFVGARTFRTALRYYLRDNSYGIGYPEDMYAAFQRAASEDLEFTRLFPDVDIGAVFDSWVQNPGSPVLNVTFNMESGLISINQERYLLSGPPTEVQTWQIPITWTQAGSADFTNTRPSMLLSTPSATIQAEPGHNWVMFNIAQSGLYRVSYDDHNWEMIASFLRNDNNRQTVHKLNRAQIVNDVLYFLRSGRISPERAFDVLSFLELETDYYVWNGALGQLDWIRSRLRHLPVGHTVFSEYLLHIIDRVIQHLGYDERDTDSTSTILNRMQIMNLACNLGHEGCISDSLAKWNRFKENDEAVPVNQRRYVYCTGLREGDATDYTFLFNKYNASENTADMVVILRALACTKDTTSFANYLYQSMYNDKIRIHDRTNVFTYALQGNPENLPAVLNFLYEDFEEIRTTYGGDARLTICINAVPGFLSDFSDIQTFQTWAYTNQIALGESFDAAASVVTSAMTNLDWASRNAEDIHTEVLERSSAVTFTSSIFVLIVAYIVHLLH